MISVLFVCLGNICRSPLGEGVFKALLREKGLEEQFIVDSAGTAGYHIGKLPDPGSRKVAKKYGFSIDDQRARQIQQDDLKKWDYIIAMDDSNYSNIKKLGRVEGELHLMREFDPEEKGRNVPDPWQMGDSAFDEVHTIVRRSCEKMLAYILSKQ